MDRWRLPGPYAFLQQVADTLRDGINLVVACPAGMAKRLSSAIDVHLRDEGWSLAGPVEPRGGAPIDDLFDALELDDLDAHRRTVALLRQVLPPMRIVLVNGVGGAFWPAWRKLLVEYESASRSLSTFERPLLLLVTDGVPATAMPASAAALRTICWNGVVGEIETLIYAIEALRQLDRPIDARNKLLAHMVVRLSLWDLDLADYLLKLHPTSLFQPQAVLRTALDSGSLSPPIGATWEDGGTQRFGGQDLLHPLVLVGQGDPEGQLLMRAWAAQAAEILPVLELHRRALARRMRSSGLELPVQLDDERITDLDALELGQLARLASSLRLGQDIQRTARKWRDLRNKLAHLVPLNAVEALDVELLGKG